MNRVLHLRQLLVVSALAGWLAPACAANPDSQLAMLTDVSSIFPEISPGSANPPTSTPWAAGTEAAASTSVALTEAAGWTASPWVAGTDAAASTSAALTEAAGSTPTPWAAGTEAAASTSAALTQAAGPTPTPWVTGTEAATQTAAASVTTGPAPTATPWISGTQTADAGRWITVVGNSVTFDCPAYWHPTRTAPADALSDAWSLAIPEAVSATISFGGAGLERFRPPTELIIVDSIVTIGGKPGFKWIRRTEVGGSDILYEYMTTGLNDEGVFGFDALLHEMDASVELQLDRLTETVVFLEAP